MRVRQDVALHPPNSPALAYWALELVIATIGLLCFSVVALVGLFVDILSANDEASGR